MIKYLPLLFCTSAFAHNYHYIDQTNVYQESNGTALAIASAQHHFDFGTHVWQGSVGYGNYNDTDALSFGLGKRFDRVLINGSIGTEEGEIGFGAGVNWRF